MTLIDKQPNRVGLNSLIAKRRRRVPLRLGHFVFSYKMLNKIVLSEGDMIAIRHVADPSIEMPMALHFVSSPIGLPFEGLGLSAVRKGTCVWLEILMHMLRPVRRFGEFLHSVANRTFKLSWKS